MRCIEGPIRLSDSQCWQAQKAYYQEAGLSAFDHIVPSFITSNTFIAESYARMMLGVVQDYLAKMPEAIHHTFYFLELGVGHGKFSYYFLKAFESLLVDAQLGTLSWTYVISDASQKNIDDIMAQSVFNDFVSRGKLDAARFDLSDLAPIVLQCSGGALMQCSVNPLFLVANYVFGSIPADLFYVNAGKLHEAQVSFYADKETMGVGASVDWSGVDARYEYVGVASAYNDEPDFSALLTRYQCSLKESSVLFPIGALRAIAYLADHAKAGIFLLASDNGCTELSALEGLADPNFSVHGSVSLVVNFDAIITYCQRLGGYAMTQSTHAGLKTVALSLGMTIKEFPIASREMDFYINRYSPADFYHNYTALLQSDVLDLKALVSFLSLSAWDPHVFHVLRDRLLDLIEGSDYETCAALRIGLHHVVAHYYSAFGGQDTFFDAAVVAQALGEYKDAINFYASSLGHKAHLTAFFNQGICYYQLTDYTQARQCFLSAQSLDEQRAPAIVDWLTKTETLGAGNTGCRARPMIPLGH